MNTVTQLEQHVRDTLVTVSADVAGDAAIANRLIVNARAPRHARLPRHVRWVAPLAAAAAVAATVFAVALATRPSGSHAVPAGGSTSQASLPGPRPTAASPAPTASAGAPVDASGPVLRGFTPKSTSMLDARSGYAIGTLHPCPSQECAALAATTDGGATWHRIDAKGRPYIDFATCGNNGVPHLPCVSALRFADADRGYLFNANAVFSTDDGGRTWHDDGGSAYELVIAGDRAIRRGWVAPCSANCATRLEYSTVGSHEWHEFRPAGSRAGRSYDLLTVGADVVVGEDLTDGSPSLWRSSDAGRTWRRIDTADCSLRGRVSAAPDGALAVGCLDADSTDPTVRVVAPGAQAVGPAVPLPSSVSSLNGFVPEARSATSFRVWTTADGVNWTSVGYADGRWGSPTAGGQPPATS